MRKLSAFLLSASALVAGSAASAQETSGLGACAVADTLIVRGNSRIPESSIRSEVDIPLKSALNFRVVQRAYRALFATGQYDSVQIYCAATGQGDSTHAALVVDVKERPVLLDVDVEGVKRLSERTVKDQVDLLTGRPVDPSQVAHSIQRIDSLYEKQGYYLARIRAETTFTDNQARIVFKIDEGRRLAISGVRVIGNTKLSDNTVVAAMKTRPEGFWWFRKGEFNDDKYAADLAEHIPQAYASRGFIDFQILKDTLIVDREHGKALIELQVSEGQKYKVGNFEVVGNTRFSTEELVRFYPFSDEGTPLLERVPINPLHPLRRVQRREAGMFDQARWTEATQRVNTAYNNEGYIYANVRPVLERRAGVDSASGTGIVDLRWEINEGAPAIINRVDIAGNTYTIDPCIRSSLVIVPGQVFNQDAIIRSWQQIGNMGFFEAPVAQPDIRPNESGDVDITFHVKERQTGNVNFGASMGQGVGVGGFFALEQPNLFGRCKRGSLQWQFGQYINDFNISYTDPSIRQTRYSGTVTVYNSIARYTVGNLGRQRRIGGSLQFGVPVRNSPYSRLFVSYGAERVEFGNTGFLAGAGDSLGAGFRSTLGLTASRDTRIGMPFAVAGSMQTITSQFNGGPLGGSQNYQRYSGEVRSYAPLGQVGGSKPGSQPVQFTLGVTARAGTLFGDPGSFFASSGGRFALGGVQFGEQLRGYGEFCVTPNGVVGGSGGQCNAQFASFGNAFFSSTVEFGVRINQMFYVNAFHDAGNVWQRAREFDPTRLVRGAGLGLSTITPLGPLGLDWAYGFDRVDTQGRPAPGWQLHFRLGQLF
ncbi:MAG TPA: outer membrane protein assembly factor BamA [Gemmatimonadaceae bacterium]|nr:outer membrane protein assembly factor BamA [Gemmatimonadaceae bacterium]